MADTTKTPAASTPAKAEKTTARRVLEGIVTRDKMAKTRRVEVERLVRHAKYGTGVVLRSEGAGDDAKLTVSFPGFGQKKFVAKFAALEKA